MRDDLYVVFQAWRGSLIGKDKNSDVMRIVRLRNCAGTDVQVGSSYTIYSVGTVWRRKPEENHRNPSPGQRHQSTPRPLRLSYVEFSPERQQTEYRRLPNSRWYVILLLS